MRSNKFFALLLAVVMCLTLVSCKGRDGETDTDEQSSKNSIVGEWKSADGKTLCFNKDGTVIWDGSEFKWTYNDESDLYTIHMMVDINFSIREENKICYIAVMGRKYYHEDDYEKGVESEVVAAQNELNCYIEGRTKIEIGKSYDYAEGVTIEFLGASVIDYGEGCVCIDAAFTSESSVKQEYIYSVAYKTHYIYDNVNVSWSSSDINWGANLGEYCGAEELEPGATVITRGAVFNLFRTPVESINIMICCFEINGIEYYMDLSEYLK